MAPSEIVKASWEREGRGAPDVCGKVTTLPEASAVGKRTLFPLTAVTAHSVLVLMLSCIAAICDPEPARAGPVEQAVCRLIDVSAHVSRLPASFLTRLVWRESSFRRDAVSTAGAQGVAQFMPGTARARGVTDPFDPEQAIPQAATFLAALRDRFGNLGLAAAAYNAGAGRVAAWLAGKGALPAETELYVRDVTGQAAAAWAQGGVTLATNDAACAAVLSGILRDEPAEAARSVLSAPWGVQLSGAFSRAAAVADYRRQQRRYAAALGDLQPMVIGGRKPGRGFRPFFQVRAPAPSRVAAEKLCGAILHAGGACSVLRS